MIFYLTIFYLFLNFSLQLFIHMKFFHLGNKAGRWTLTYSIKLFSLSFQIKFRSNLVQMQHFVFPNFWQFCRANILAGNSNQRQCYQNLPLNFKNQSQILLIALLLKNDCTFFCALSKLTRVDPTKIGHIKRNTFFTVFRSSFSLPSNCWNASFNKSFWQDFLYIFLQFFLLLWCKFTISSLFQCFSLVFWDLLTRSYFFILQIMPTIFNKFIFSQKKGRLFFALCSTRITSR